MKQRAKSQPAPQVPTGSDRKRSMVNVWVGKQAGADLEEFALKEQSATGHTTTKTGLAREIFTWAFRFYVRAGSLAGLKSMRAISISSRFSEQLQEDAYSQLETIFRTAPSPIIEKVTRMLHKDAGTFGGEK